MRSLFWVALNFIGFVILIFMYAHRYRSNAKKTVPQRLFGYMLLSVMLFLLFDTGMFLLDGTTFQHSTKLNYACAMLFYLVSPLTCLFYLLYFDSKIFKNISSVKNRLFYYLIPLAINTVAVAFTPSTNAIFYIGENNIYTRGDYYWLPILLSFLYVISVYPIFAILSKKKQISNDYGENTYLLLFPILPIVMAVFQMLNYGVMLIGFGFVLSTFLIYTSSLQSADDRRSLAVRCHNLNIIQFIVISFVLMAGIFWVLEKTIDDISKDYAAYNSAGTAHILETYLNREIGVLGAAARSRAVVEWMADEHNEEKKRAAFEELMNTQSMLYNSSMYIVVKNSGREFTIEGEIEFEAFISHAEISQDNPKDKWVFDLMAQDQEYNLNVDIDKGHNRKRVWLNFKVMRDGEAIGIICSGMELVSIAEQALVLQSRHNKMSRTFIIDENGNINMDSELLGDTGFILEDDTQKFYDVITDPNLLAAIRAHLGNIVGYFDEFTTESHVVSMQAGQYRYAAITPIGRSSWSLITLYDSSSLFDIRNLFSLFVIITAMLIIFAYSSNTITARLIFKPLKKLVASLVEMRTNNTLKVYGTNRNDEIGVLSNAIEDFFVKGYYDELTGIYNRRYLETTMQQIMTTLSRAECKLSVMLIDIDNFKKYNDTYGHDEGDKCLKKVAAALNSAIQRKGDFVARYGGEEFAVVLPHTDEVGARGVAESLLYAVRNLKIPHEKNVCDHVTISIGVTTSNDTTTLQSSKACWKKADDGLYMSKENGRNQYTFNALEEEKK